MALPAPPDVNVPRSGTERAVSALGGVLSAARGEGPQDSPLIGLMSKHHQQRQDEAEKHYNDYKTYTTAILTRIDPLTTDPKTGDHLPLTAEQAEKYDNLRKASADALDKTLGQNKDAKGKLQKMHAFFDHLISLKQGGEGADPSAQNAQGAPPSGAGMPQPPGWREHAEAQMMQEGQARAAERQEWQHKQDALEQAKIREEQAKAEAEAKAGGNARGYEGHPITIADARRDNISHVDAQGNEIDLNKLPEQELLYPVYLGRGRMYWRTGSASQTNTIYDNIVHRGSRYDPSGGTEKGAARVPTTTVHTEPGIDPNTGEVKPLQKSSVSTPGGNARLTAPPIAVSTDVVPFGAGNQIRQAVVPVREAATQIFGDPTQPSLKSLKDFAPMADDPGARRRLSTAFNLTMNAYDAEIKRSGGLLTWIEYEGGLPQALAKISAQVRAQAVKNLRPNETEHYDGVMSAYGALIGLRSLTKASAAQFSAKKLEQELPLVGINSTSSAQYYDQLSRLAEQVYNGTRTLPMPKEEKDYYKAQVGELNKLKEQKRAPVKGLPAPPRASKSKQEDEFEGLMDEIKAAKSASTGSPRPN